MSSTNAETSSTGTLSILSGLLLAMCCSVWWHEPAWLVQGGDKAHTGCRMRCRRDLPPQCCVAAIHTTTLMETFYPVFGAVMLPQCMLEGVRRPCAAQVR